MSNKRQERIMGGILFLLLLSFLFSSFLVQADPSGTTISNPNTEFAPNASPSSRSDPRSTVTTMVLTAVQQTSNWKAYVGNVSGTLTLDNADNATIFDWDLVTIQGEVYASRFDNLTWGNTTCANASNIIDEQIFNNMTISNVDRINQTFNYTVHPAYIVGPSTIDADTCSSTATYVNETRTVPSASQAFVEILVKDENNQFIYLTSIDDDEYGFNNVTYDFQMIVAESAIKSSPTTYYFYAELG